MNEFSKCDVPLHVGLPVTAFKAPSDLLRDEFSANLVKVGEYSINPEPYRVCRLLCLSKTDVKFNGLREPWGEKGVLRQRVFNIWRTVFLKFEVAITERYWKVGRVNQVYRDPEYVTSWLVPSSPVGKYYPLVKLGLHQIRLLADGSYCANGYHNADDANDYQCEVEDIWRL